MKDSRRQSSIALEGGLDLESSPLKIAPGRMISCRNFEVDALGGYTRSMGYERFDGQPSPSEADNDTDAGNRRAAIAKPPGSGPIRGVWVYNNKVYAFRDNAGATECKMWVSSGTGWTEVTTGVTLTAGGRYEFLNYNFLGNASSQVMVGTDGVNPAFVYDGTNFDQITITGESSFPAYCAAVNNYLFLGFKEGYFYYPSTDDPTDYNGASGAGQIGVGDEIVGLEPVVGGALAIRMADRMSILYGSGPSDWANKDVRHQEDLSGSVAHSAVTYGNLYYIGDQGITSLQATERFGNFLSASMSRNIYSAIDALKRNVESAYPVKSKNQIRWLFSPLGGGTVSEQYTLTFAGNQMAGFSRQVYNHHFTCSAAYEIVGKEVIFAGTEDGWVMQLEKGTNFDGTAIRARMQTAYHHVGSPMQRKHFKNAVFNIEGPDITINVKPTFNYSSPDVGSHRKTELDASTEGGEWNDAKWNEFKWSAQVISEGFADIAGTGRNISWIIVSDTDTAPFTINEILLFYTARNWYR